MSTEVTSENDLSLFLGMLTLRLWLAMRSLQTGLEKFTGMTSGATPVEIDGAANSYGLTESTMTKTYGFGYYQGVPGPLYDKFLAEPLIPAFGLTLYNLFLGPVLLLLGVTLLIGVATRFTLFAMGLVYASLTFGLILIKQDAGVAWLGIHIIMIVGALVLSKHNRFTVLKKW